MKRSFRRSLKKYILAGLVAVSCLSANAQFAASYLQAADNYFKKGDYFSAAQYYEKYLNKNNTPVQKSSNPYSATGKLKIRDAENISREEVAYKAGESYQLLHNFVKAEPYFRDAVTSTAHLPLARYWYAKTLKANLKFDEAEVEFNKFIQEYAKDDNYGSDATREIKSLQFRKSQLQRKDIAGYQIRKLAINAAGATSAPAILNDALVFSSTRPDSNAAPKSTFTNRLYSSNTATLSEVEKLNIAQGKGEHVEGASFTPDGTRMYLTKWTLKDGHKNAAIYVSTKSDNKWTEPVALDSTINESGYNSQQPFITKDGKYIYYSSNKPGGVGNFDIWVAQLFADGHPAVSKNLGAEINTAGDEYAPSYHGGTSSLVFSSNGRVGMGGFDFYVAKSEAGHFVAPANLGYPVNSAKDDIYFVSASGKYLLDTFYFSSDRSSECCLELFGASKARAKKHTTGTIVDCLTGAPMAGVNVKLVDNTSSDARLKNNTTSSEGKYDIVMDEFAPLTIAVDADGYISKTISLNNEAETDLIVNPTVCLEQPDKKPFVAENTPIVIPNIYFDVNKSTIKPESFQVLDSLAGLMERYPTLAIEVSGHTDNFGEDDYNQSLSENRAKAFKKYLIEKGIEASRIESKGYGKTMPIAPNFKENGRDNPAGRKINRRSEVKVLHY